MTTSIVERCRRWIINSDNCFGLDDIGRDCKDAADLIEQQVGEITELKADAKRLDAIANGFSIWQTIEADDSELWFCQHSIDGIVSGASLREALDKGIVANDARTNSKA